MATFVIAFAIPGTDVIAKATLSLNVPSKAKFKPNSRIMLRQGIFVVGDFDRRVMKTANTIRLYSALLNRKDGKPVRDPGRVITAFKKFEADGWSVDLEEFRKFHFHKKPTAAQQPQVPAAPQGDTDARIDC